MADFRIQRFNVGLVSNSGTPGLMLVDIPIMLLDKTRTRLVMGNQRGDAYIANTTDDQSNIWESRDFMAAAFVLSESQIIIVWDASKLQSSRLSFSTLEYVGAQGGANEFTVVRGLTSIPTGIAFRELSMAAIGTSEGAAAKVTLCKTGSYFSNSSQATEGELVKRTTVAVGIEFEVDFDTARHAFFHCGDASGPDITIAWEAIDWSGSNWGITRAGIGEATALIDGQTEADYDDSPTSEGVFVGGTGHGVSDVITLTDGSEITVDSLSGSVVLTFTVAQLSGRGGRSGQTLTQLSTTGSGTGFTLTPGGVNVMSLGGWSKWQSGTYGLEPSASRPSDWSEAWVEGSHSIEANSALLFGGDGLMNLMGRNSLDRVFPAKGGTSTTTLIGTRDNSIVYYAITNPDIHSLGQGTFPLHPFAFPAMLMTSAGPTRLSDVYSLSTGEPDPAFTAPSKILVTFMGFTALVTTNSPAMGTQDHSMSYDPESQKIRELRTRTKMSALNQWWYVVQFGADEEDTSPTEPLSVIDAPKWTAEIEPS